MVSSVEKDPRRPLYTFGSSPSIVIDIRGLSSCSVAIMEPMTEFLVAMVAALLDIVAGRLSLLEKESVGMPTSWNAVDLDIGMKTINVRMTLALASLDD